VTETEQPEEQPGRRRAHQTENFDASYAARTAPWDIGRAQPAFLELANAGHVIGRVLDVGCGTGEHALMAANMGLEATGLDTSARALAAARDKARDRGLSVRFLEHDALDLGRLDEHFDTVLDCGLFHIFEDRDRPGFVEGLRASVPSGGHYYMLSFSDRQPGDWGPRRIREQEIRDSFADGWTIESIEPAKIEVTTFPGGIEAWLATVVRT
jgi:ubiquinone/menaquinone biosynthesis C-methylase UbiE